MKMVKSKSLLFFSWVITTLTLIFIYGGLHLDDGIVSVLRSFSSTLVILINIPMFVSCFLPGTIAVDRIKWSITSIFSTLIQIWILSFGPGSYI